MRSSVRFGTALRPCGSSAAKCQACSLAFCLLRCVRRILGEQLARAVDHVDPVADRREQRGEALVHSARRASARGPAASTSIRNVRANAGSAASTSRSARAPARSGAASRRSRRRARRAREQDLDADVPGGQEALLLVGEVLVEGLARDAGARDHVGDRRRGRSPSLATASRHRLQQPPALRRRARPRGARRGGRGESGGAERGEECTLTGNSSVSTRESATPMTATLNRSPPREPRDGSAPRPRRHRRRRLRRPRHGDPPQAGGHRRLRRSASATPTSAAPGGRTPIPAASATSPRTSTRSRSRPTRTGRRTFPLQPEICALPARRAPSASALRPHIRVRAARSPTRDWDEDARRWRIETDRGRLHRRRAGRRARRPERAVDPRPARPRRFEGAAFHTARWDHDHDLDRQARRGDRHRRVGDPDRARRSSRWSSSSTSSSARRRGSCRTATGRSPTSSARVYRRFPALQRAGARGVYWGRELLVPASSYRPQLMKRRRSGSRARHLEQAGRRPGAARASSRPTTDRLQAHPALQRLVPGAHAAERRASSPTASPRSAPNGDRRRRRRRSTRSTRSSSRTGFHVTDMPLRRASSRGRDGAHARPRPGTAARRPTAAPRSPASPTCSCSRARTPASATTRSSS